MTAEEKLTDEKAAEMLETLSKHFRQPVMPMSRYCDGLRTWQTALHKRAERLRVKLFPDTDFSREDLTKDAREAGWVQYRKEMPSTDSFTRQTRPGGALGIQPTERDRDIEQLRQYIQFAESVDYVFLQIQKSSLLARVLYAGESLRTVLCPIHQGTWNGQAMLRGCKAGCDGEGWLREELPIEKLNSALFCEHANEVPTACPCKMDCYCKENTCSFR